MKNKLLIEEIKRFKLISEYSFFTPDNDKLIGEDDEEIGDESSDAVDAGLDSAEGGEEPNLSFDGEEIDPGMEDDSVEGGEESETGDLPEPDMEELPEPEGEMNLGGEPESEPEMDVEDTGEEEVELDITQLVDKSEEAIESSDAANEKISMMLNKFAELEQKLPKMDILARQLEDIKADIVKRNPTEVEKLEMRSMDSFPYNIKLSDYWADKENTGDNYDTGVDQDGNQKEKEYVLTQDDVDSDYSEKTVRDSFKYSEEDI